MNYLAMRGLILFKAEPNCQKWRDIVVSLKWVQPAQQRWLHIKRGGALLLV